MELGPREDGGRAIKIRTQTKPLSSIRHRVNRRLNTQDRLTRLCSVKRHNHFKKSVLFLFMSLKLYVNLYYLTISTLPKNV